MPLAQILFNMVEKQIAAICKNVRMSFLRFGNSFMGTNRVMLCLGNGLSLPMAP